MKLHKIKNQMLNFINLIDELEQTGSKLKKIDLIANYLVGLDQNELYHTCNFLTGSIYSPVSNKTLNIGKSIIKKALIKAASTTEEAFILSYKNSGDIGIVASDLMSRNISTSVKSLTTISEFVKFKIDKLSSFIQLFDDLLKIRSNNEKTSYLQNIFSSLKPSESKFFAKLISSNLRIGVQSATIEAAISKAFSVDLKLVQKINFYIGDIGQTAIRCKLGDTSNFQFVLFHPIPAMLASSELVVEDIFKRFGRPIWCEYKYDGVRVHIHATKSKVKLYTRDLKEITIQFPEVAKEIEDIVIKNDIENVLIDGEIVPFYNSQILPFSFIQKRLGRKGDLSAEILQNPCSVICYDLLFLDNEPLFEKPLKERRALAQSHLIGMKFSELSYLRDIQEFNNFFKQVKKDKLEGIMIKNPDSQYESGKRGTNWIKYKQTLDPLDVIVTKGEYGNGKNSNKISLLTVSVWDENKINLLEIGRVYSGLSENDLEELNKQFDEIQVSTDSSGVILKPQIILEIAFENIQKSLRYNSKYAIRFPRVLKIRTDKPVSEASTIKEVTRYYKALTGKE